MFKQWLMIIGLLIPLIGCESLSFLQGHSNQPVIQTKIDKLFYTPGEVTRIDVRGDVILNIHTGARRPWFSMHGDSRDLRKVEWHVSSKNKTLRIRLAGRFPKHGAVTIDVGLRQLDALTMRGKVRATLTGRIAPRYIEMRDKTYLNIPQLKARDVSVRMRDQSCAQLRGSAQWASISLQDNARFNGRYLRITEAFVRTQDNAIAQIFVTTKEHTLATGRSNIYYYHDATYQTDFMAKNGAVLNLNENRQKIAPS